MGEKVMFELMFELMEQEMGRKDRRKALLGEFFPSALFPLEQEWWIVMMTLRGGNYWRG